MKLIINIPEEYKVLFDTERCKSKFDSLATNEFGYVLRKAFENGTPLPKGHGRIVDIGQYEGKIIASRKYYGVNKIVEVAELDTIIEAESEDT